MSEINFNTYEFIKDQYIMSTKKEKNFRELLTIVKARLSKYNSINFNINYKEYIYLQKRAHLLTNLYRKFLNDYLYIRSKWEMVKMCKVKMLDANRFTIENDTQKKKVKICTEMNEVYVFES